MAVLCAGSRPPHGAAAPQTASARPPRAPAVAPPPRPAPPPRAIPRGTPLKLAKFAFLAPKRAKHPFFGPKCWQFAALLRPQRRLRPREGRPKFSQNSQLWDSAAPNLQEPAWSATLSTSFVKRAGFNNSKRGLVRLKWPFTSSAAALEPLGAQSTVLARY